MNSRITTRTIPTRGPFSLEEANGVGFGHRDEKTFDGVMRLTFTVDGDHERAAGVEVRQRGETLDLTIHTDADRDVVAAQVARILSVDVDGQGFVELGLREPVIGRLQHSAPGLRPPQFTNPFEAAAWSIISFRRSRFQGIKVRSWLNEGYGTPFDLAGQRHYAFPSPSRLLEVETIPGLPAYAVPRLHEVARWAANGDLDVSRLVTMSPDDAMSELQRLPGIGPFYSALVVVRACGLPDVLPLIEPRSRAMIERLYGIAAPLSDEDYLQLAERWRPYRMWVTFLARAAGGRVVDPD